MDFELLLDHGSPLSRPDQIHLDKPMDFSLLLALGLLGRFLHLKGQTLQWIDTGTSASGAFENRSLQFLWESPHTVSDFAKNKRGLGSSEGRSPWTACSLLPLWPRQPAVRLVCRGAVSVSLRGMGEIQSAGSVAHRDSSRLHGLKAAAGCPQSKEGSAPQMVRLFSAESLSWEMRVESSFHLASIRSLTSITQMP